MSGYFQIGASASNSPYSGEYGVQAIYGGTHTTVTQSGATLASGDTIEIVLAEIPAGVKVNSVKWAVSATLGANTTGKLVLRKKATNNIVSTNTNVGTIPAAADRTVQVNGADISITTTAAGNAQSTIIPKTFEGLSSPKAATAEAYLLSFQVGIGTGAAFATGVDVFAAVEGEFVGTL